MHRREVIKVLLHHASALAGVSFLSSCHREHQKTTKTKEEPVKPSPPLVSSDPKPWVVKAQRFDDEFPDDLYLTKDQLEVLSSVLKKMELAQDWYGYGDFNILSFDALLRLPHWVSKIQEFNRVERACFEEMFFRDARDYGFFGEKVVTDLNFNVSRKDTIKIPGTGHYLYRGESLKTYEQLQKDVGPSLILTSGIRGVSKQFLLFFRKVREVNGNLSRAARSLAPPGYSFHACGDFDVGKHGFGELNFTAKFSETQEFQKLLKLGYIGLRYYPNNPFGVRYEPWHIEGLKRA